MQEVKIVNEQVVLGKEFKVYGSVEQPLFLAKDIADWVGERDGSTVARKVDDDEKLIHTICVGGQNRDVTMLTEDGLYEVLMKGRSEFCKQFKKEVKKVLKQIRLTGGTVVEDREEEFINNYFPSFSEDVKLAMVQDLRVQNTKLKTQLEEAQPMIAFAEMVAESSDTIDMGEMAKLCAKEGIKIGRNRLFDFLRGEGVLRQNNEPYQKYIDGNWFTVIETTKNTPYGQKLFIKVLCTGRGQIKIVELVRNKYQNSAA